MIRAHTAAILERLRANGVLADATYEGLVLPDADGNRPQRYVSVFTNSGHRSIERLSGPSSTATFTYVIHSVGSDPWEAQAVAEHVFAQLLDFTPNVPERICGRLRHVSTQPVQMDDDSTPALFYCVDEFDLTTDPA